MEHHSAKFDQSISQVWSVHGSMGRWTMSPWEEGFACRTKHWYLWCETKCMMYAHNLWLTKTCNLSIQPSKVKQAIFTLRLSPPNIGLHGSFANVFKKHPHWKCLRAPLTFQRILCPAQCCAAAALQGNFDQLRVRTKRCRCKFQRLWETEKSVEMDPPHAAVVSGVCGATAAYVNMRTWHWLNACFVYQTTAHTWSHMMHVIICTNHIHDVQIIYTLYTTIKNRTCICWYLYLDSRYSNAELTLGNTQKIKSTRFRMF